MDPGGSVTAYARDSCSGHPGAGADLGGPRVSLIIMPTGRSRTFNGNIQLPLKCFSLGCPKREGGGVRLGSPKSSDQNRYTIQTNQNWPVSMMEGNLTTVRYVQALP